MMRYRTSAVRTVAAALPSSLLAIPRAASAQGPASAEPTSSFGMVILLVMFGLALLVALGVVVRIYDVRRSREQRAMELQAKLSDALFLEPALSAFAITPTVYAPAWPRAPLNVEITGVVPTGQHRDAALQLVRREAAGLDRELRVENYIVVDPRRFMHAA